MKRLNFNIKDRKVLYMILGIVFISVFTLTVAYAALNAVLDISGRAEVYGMNWDVHFDNVKVTNGSVSGDDPRITSATTATFSTVLNMPGDFYEFTIDVVNDGSIDAMIENITKTPTLSSDQAKYLKYDITYQNGESITEKQLVERKSFVRLKVRLEYRSDITSSDLPTTSETLTLGLKLDYVQTDGSGSSIPVHGVGSGDVSSIEAYGSLDEVGTIVKIGTEKFYTIGTDGDNVKLLTMYNLHVGNEVVSCEDEYGNNCIVKELDSPTGKQSPDAKGATGNVFPYIGTIDFNSIDFDNYRTIIEEYGVVVNSIRHISLEEISDSETFDCENLSTCSDRYPFIYSTSYWTGGKTVTLKFGMTEGGFYDMFHADVNDYLGVRPVVVVPKDTFNQET